MSKLHSVENVEFSDEHLLLVVDGQTYRIALAACSPRLARASMAQRRRFEVSPGGYGIHWPEIDEDLAIGPLLKKAERLDASTATRS